MSLLHEFSSLPVKAKIGIGVGAAALILFIWKPWAKSSSQGDTSLTTMETGIPIASGGGYTDVGGQGGGTGGSGPISSGGSGGIAGGQTGVGDGGSSKNPGSGKGGGVGTPPKTPPKQSSHPAPSPHPNPPKGHPAAGRASNHSGGSLPTTLVYGSHGSTVKHLQTVLNQHGWHLQTDGIFGPKTRQAVKIYQAHHGLSPDGIVGKQTWTNLLDAAPKTQPDHKPTRNPSNTNPMLRIGARGNAVKSLQQALNRNGWHLQTDGVFGPQTLHAVKVYQTHHGLSVDGIVGTQTWTSLAHTGKGGAKLSVKKREKTNVNDRKGGKPGAHFTVG